MKDFYAFDAVRLYQGTAGIRVRADDKTIPHWNAIKQDAHPIATDTPDIDSSRTEAGP